MATTIDSPAKCELQCVIPFLQVEGLSVVEILRGISQVYGEDFMNDNVVLGWCRKFKEWHQRLAFLDRFENEDEF